MATKTLEDLSGEDVIDSRDIIERIDELEAIENRDTEEADELETLKKFADEASGYADDWEHGVTLINDAYFQTYAEELAYDIGAVNKDATWPNNHIDWRAAADELKHDYTMVTLVGDDYWLR